MSKDQLFMMMVQTGLILHYVKRDHGEASAVWAIEHLKEAADVVSLIPEDVAPSEAAQQFLRLILRPPDYDPSECPAWLAEDGTE
jgi:hypothetical protein